MKKAIICLLAVGLVTSCTKKFDEINTDPSKMTKVGKREMPFMFANAQSAAGLRAFQTLENLGADLYAQYFATSVTTFQNDRYVLKPAWLGRFYTAVYAQTAPQLKAIIDNSEAGSGEAALANIWWVFAFHRLTDEFGPIPYFDASEPKEVIPYDPQDKIYDDFFKRLDAAVKDLKALPSGTTVFKGYELMYNGDVDKWIRFANTLRLRLALRISDVDPSRAKTEAEAAVASGVMLENSQNAALLKSLQGNDINKLSQTAAYNEFSMSSTIASYLKGYADPRLSKYFQPSIATGEFNSLRNGLPAVELGKSRNTSAYNSNIGTYWVIPSGSTFVPNLEAPFIIMNSAEAYFLRAEGALNGWNMDGNAKDLYEKGIATSLRQWGTSEDEITSYLNSDALPVAPGDSKNSPAVAVTPIKWAMSEDVQRAQIGTQKWLALYPRGIEAWAEFRRTGFPKMYPVVQSQNADLPQGVFIKRFPYPSSEEVNNLEELTKGRALLGGPDNAATRVWWDKD